MSNGRLASISGLYRAHAQASGGANATVTPEELRLAIDGLHPSISASGFLKLGNTDICWYAPRLIRADTGEFSGKIEHLTTLQGSPLQMSQGDKLTEVEIAVSLQMNGIPDFADVRFLATGVLKETRHFPYASPYFREIELEIDVLDGLEPILDFDNNSIQPVTIDDLGILTLKDIYQNAGINVKVPPPLEFGRIAIGDATRAAAEGDAGTWSKAELHQAMQKWQKDFRDTAQGKIWLFFTTRYEKSQQPGMMFDFGAADFGAQRQGAAVFLDDELLQKYEQQAANPLQGKAKRRREAFFTAVHEVGHCFNLLDKWQPVNGAEPWLKHTPLSRNPNPPEDAKEKLRFFSLMSPVRFGSSDPNQFFSECRFEFADDDLQFVHHAPSFLVEPGGAAFRGSQAGAEPDSSGFKLKVTGFRSRKEYAFLEPPILQLRLKNISGERKQIPDGIFRDDLLMRIFITKRGEQSKLYRPYVRHCFPSTLKPMENREVITESLWIASGLDGWYVRDPGDYSVFVILHLPDGMVKSNTFEFSVREREPGDKAIEERWFTDEVGRIIRLGGTRDPDLLYELVHLALRYGKRPFAPHLALALGVALAKKYKVLESSQDKEKNQRFQLKPLAAELEPCQDLVLPSLIEASQVERIAKSIGHVRLKRYVIELANAYADEYKINDSIRFIETFQSVIQSPEAPKYLHRCWIETALKETGELKATLTSKK